MFVKACTLSVMAKTNKHTRQANVHLFVGFCGNWQILLCQLMVNVSSD